MNSGVPVTQPQVRVTFELLFELDLEPIARALAVRGEPAPNLAPMEFLEHPRLSLDQKIRVLARPEFLTREQLLELTCRWLEVGADALFDQTGTTGRLHKAVEILRAGTQFYDNKLPVLAQLRCTRQGILWNHMQRHTSQLPPQVALIGAAIEALESFGPQTALVTYSALCGMLEERDLRPENEFARFATDIWP